MHKVTKRMHFVMAPVRVHMSVQLRTPLRFHLKAHLRMYFEIYTKIHKTVHLKLKLRVCLRCNNWAAVEDAHGGALVSTPNCTKRCNKNMNLWGHSILLLRPHPIFHSGELLKMPKNEKKKMHFMLQLMIHLTLQSRVHLRVLLILHWSCTCDCTCWCNHQCTVESKWIHLIVDLMYEMVHLMVYLMLDLKGHPRVQFKSNWICIIKWQRGCTWRNTWWCT